MTRLAIVSDQHDVMNLERIVVSLTELSYNLILAGDTCPHQKEDSDSSLLKIKYKISGSVEKREDFYEKFIEELSKGTEDYDQMLLWYGCSPFFTLARKWFVSQQALNNNLKPVVSIRGHEPTLDRRQRQLFEKIKQQEGIDDEQLLENLLNVLRVNAPDIHENILDALEYCDIANPQQYLKETLSPNNFQGHMPTSYEVVSKIPVTENFIFIERMHIQSYNGLTVIFVPLYETDFERERDVHLIEEYAALLSENAPDNLLIVYHGHPLQELLTKGKRKPDSNKNFIDQLLFCVAQSYDIDKTHMFNGHLHISCDRFDYQFAPGKNPVKSTCLGIRDIVLFDTSKDEKLKILDYKKDKLVF